MERTHVGFEGGSSAPGELVRGVVMLELPTALSARRFDVVVQGVQRREVVIAVSQLGAPVTEERQAFEFPLLLEVLHVPVGFSRREDGMIVMPQGFYFLRFTFRIPDRTGSAAPGPAAFDAIHVAVRLLDASGMEVETTEELPTFAEKGQERRDPVRHLQPV